ncbi:MAG TPA: ABC transporter permease [Aestuariivirgaceae bacterium]|nr:ABC transporter permease [Aestuariivirgaceae bacterium]
MSASLLRILAVKLAGAVVAVVGAVLLLLSLTLLIPGDPATVLLGPRATPETVAALKTQMGFDLPLPLRLVHFLSGALTGDLGIDVMTNRPVVTMIADALPNTAMLAAAAMALALAIGIPLGVAGAVRPGSRLDDFIAFISVGFVSAPSFVVSIFLLLVFAVWLRWFPVLGAGDEGDIADQLRHLALPALALASGWIGYIARLLRSSLLEVLGEPHIRTMRAYGVAEWRVLFKYAFKPASIPTLAIIGMGIGELLGGAVFAEVIFNRPGLGSLIYTAIGTRNYPVVQGGVLVVVVLFVVTNLTVELLYAAIDPRIRSRMLAEGARS